MHREFIPTPPISIFSLLASPYPDFDVFFLLNPTTIELDIELYKVMLLHKEYEFNRIIR